MFFFFCYIRKRKNTFFSLGCTALPAQHGGTHAQRLALNHVGDHLKEREGEREEERVECWSRSTSLPSLSPLSAPYLLTLGGIASVNMPCVTSSLARATASAR